MNHSAAEIRTGVVTQIVVGSYVVANENFEGEWVDCTTIAEPAAGVTWTCVVASAPWAARLGHTSVIDAGGAIYVIGGEGRSVLDDVWASATGGA